MKTFFLEITMILGEKMQNRRQNQSEVFFFFRDRYDFGRNIAKSEMKSK